MGDIKRTENYYTPLTFLHPDLENLIHAMTDIAAKVTDVADMDEFIRRSVRLAQQFMGYDEVILYLCGPDGQSFTSKAVANRTQRDVVKTYSFEDDVSLAYVALQQKQIVRIHNLALEAPDFYPTNPLRIRSELHLPIERGNRVLGVLSLRSANIHLFDRYIVTALKTFLATQIATSLERARRHSNQAGQPIQNKKVTRSPSHKIDLQNILPGIQTLGSIREVFDRIVNEVVNELGYMAAMLAVLDEANQILPVQAIALNSLLRRLRVLERVEQMLGVKVIGTYASLIDDPGNLGVKSCLTGKIQISHDLHELFQPAISRGRSLWLQRLSGVKTCISIPLLVGDKVVGNLFAGTTKNEVSQDDLDALQLFVKNAAIAVQNALLFEEVNQKLAQREAELNQLRGVERMIISSSLDLNDVLKRILNGVLELTKAEYGHVVLADKYASDLTYRVSYPEVPGYLNENRPGITRWVMRDKQPKLIDNIDLVEAQPEMVSGLNDDVQLNLSKMKSQLGVPILSGEELIGVINIESPEPHAFDNQAQDVLEQLAVQAAIAITNAQQFKEQREMQKRLANADQVVAMGDVASNMVHSINNWVGSIRADTKYLLREYGQERFDSAESLEILTDMLKNAETTLAMAENIRRPFQAQVSEEIDLNECIANVLVQENVAGFPELQIIADLEENLPQVVATQQLQLVFENLVKNALRAMEHRGALRISTHCSADGQWVEAIVEDSGPGLPGFVKESDIFKLGATGREEGLGFGLWWCDTFIKRWRGDIKLIKNDHTGCTFLIRLPTVDSSVQAAA